MQFRILRSNTAIGIAIIISWWSKTVFRSSRRNCDDIGTYTVKLLKIYENDINEIKCYTLKNNNISLMYALKIEAMEKNSKYNLESLMTSKVIKKRSWKKTV